MPCLCHIPHYALQCTLQCTFLYCKTVYLCTMTHSIKMLFGMWLFCNDYTAPLHTVRYFVYCIMACCVLRLLKCDLYVRVLCMWFVGIILGQVEWLVCERCVLLCAVWNNWAVMMCDLLDYFVSCRVIRVFREVFNSEKIL